MDIQIINSSNNNIMRNIRTILLSFSAYNKLDKFLYSGLIVYCIFLFSSIYFLASIEHQGIEAVSENVKYRILDVTTDLYDNKITQANKVNFDGIFQDSLENVLIEPFILEINNKEYKGKWNLKHNNITKKENDSNIKEETKLPFENYFEDFSNANGEANLMIYIDREVNDDILESPKKIKFIFEIKDGRYREKWINIELIFYQYPKDINRNDLNFQFNLMQKEVYTKVKSKGRNKIDSVLTKMQLYKMDSIFHTRATKFELFFYNLTYNHFRGNLEFLEMGINLEIDCFQQKIYADKKISIFTLSLTFIGVIHLYHSLVLIRDILLTYANPKSFSLFLISGDILWNSIISVGNFYIAISYTKYFNDFALPSIVYFIVFSVFQIRLLFLIWRFQNLEEDLSREDAVSFRRKTMKFYLMLYLTLFSGLLMIYFILSSKILLLAIVTFTFLPQIYHNTQVNISRNKIPFNTILIISLNRLYIPLYYRACSYNIFESQPDYIFSSYAVGIILTQILILFLQSKFGALFFLPKCMRKGYFNYLKTVNEVKQMKGDIESLFCSICLGSLVEKDIQEKEHTRYNINSNSGGDFLINPRSSDFLINNKNYESNLNFNNNDITKYNSIPANATTCIERIKNFGCYKNGKKLDILMVTPCNHIFHPECLKTWGERKNECPVCRNKIPRFDI